MATLKSGVLVKLLEDIKDDSDEQITEDDRKPVLLQIRSIIPVLEEGDLWPNKGFYLKVSDMSHAIYVSLPEEENELVLNNKLRLGQFIQVQNFEKARPLPMLRGISPVPGRHQCEGSPEDILSPTTFSKLIVTLDTDSIVEKGVISEKKIVENPSDLKNLSPGLSHPGALKRNTNGLEKRSGGRHRSLSASRTRSSERIIRLHHHTDEDSDSDGTSSSTSQIPKRKSWTSSDILGVKEMFDSSVIKHEIKPAARGRSRSATASPIRSMRYDSSDDNSSSTTRRRDSRSTKKLVNSSKKIKIPAPKLIPEHASHRVFSIINDRKQAEIAIWSSLPLRLFKLGKEVVRQRDIALSTAADALQEACAAERLLNSLSTYSDFIVAKGDDLEPYVDKFFDLQDDLYHTKLIIQSLINISPLKTSETDTSGTASVKEALKVALERKKDATSWIKTAVALDLSPCSLISPNPTATPIVETHPVKKSMTSTSGRISKPKGAFVIKRSKTSDDMSLLLPSDKDNHIHHEWERGSNLSAAADLASSLQNECRKLFLGYVEKYLDEVERKISSVDSDAQIAGIMFKVKRVSDCLDVFIGKEPNSTGYQWCTSLNESEMEAYGRVRNKIYEILLKHVERTAMAMESINTSPVKL